ncbi:hypothetical protein ACP3V3_02955 [Vibrio sp. PNB22_3_1]
MIIEDAHLAMALLDTLPADVVAEKFELDTDDFAQELSSALCKEVFLTDFKRNSCTFAKRVKNGTIRVKDNTLKKLCPQCNQFKTLLKSNWYKNDASADGAYGICLQCTKEKYKAKKTQRPSLSYEGRHTALMLHFSTPINQLAQEHNTDIDTLASELAMHIINLNVATDFSPTHYYLKRKLLNQTIRVQHNTLEKLCSKCKTFLPLTRAHWHKASNTGDGSFGYCRPCVKENNRK